MDNMLLLKYDVVFNHTTLEHVFDVTRAFKNLCSLSRKYVVLVTPFLQQEHPVEDAYDDFWRPTKSCLKKLFEENNFTVVYQSSNDNNWYNIYIFTVAIRGDLQNEYPKEKYCEKNNLGCGLFGL